MLELAMRRFAGDVVADEQLHAAAHVLHRGEAGLAHHALQHHASGHRDRDLCCFQFVMRLLAELGVQVGRQMLALEIVGEGDAFRADRVQLGAALRDDLVFVLGWDVGFVAHDVLYD